MSQNNIDDEWHVVKKKVRKTKPKLNSNKTPFNSNVSGTDRINSHPYSNRERTNEQQDWKEFIIKKKYDSTNKRQNRGVTIQRNHMMSDTAKHQAKLDRETETQIHRRVKPELSKKIMAYRQANKLTQKDLAMKLSVREDIVRAYENGSAIPDGVMLGKFHRLLNMAK